VLLSASPAHLDPVALLANLFPILDALPGAHASQVGLPGDPAPPTRLTAYPNPFRSLVRLDFVLPDPGMTSARILDVQGRLVRELGTGPKPAGPAHLVWDGQDEHGRPAPSGVYFAAVAAGPFRRTQRLVLLR
jgi:hypothetical protein